MDVTKIRAGLWRWTAPHPAWRPENGGPAGWERDVGCAYYEAPGHVVLVDPLVPPEGSPDAIRFWKALDADVARLGRPVAIIVTCRGHGRSADRVRERYAQPMGSAVLAHERLRGAVAARVTDAFGDIAAPVPGVEAFALVGAEPGEVALWVPEHRALIFGDAVVGRGRGLALCPSSWLAEGNDGRARRDVVRASVRSLLARPIEVVLPSHGLPVEAGGAAALGAALAPDVGQSPA